MFIFVGQVAMAVVGVEEGGGMAAVDAWMQVLRANVGRVVRAGDSPPLA